MSPNLDRALFSVGGLIGSSTCQSRRGSECTSSLHVSSSLLFPCLATPFFASLKAPMLGNGKCHPFCQPFKKNGFSFAAVVTIQGMPLPSTPAYTQMLETAMRHVVRLFLQPLAKWRTSTEASMGNPGKPPTTDLSHALPSEKVRVTSQRHRRCRQKQLPPPLTLPGHQRCRL